MTDGPEQAVEADPIAVTINQRQLTAVEALAATVDEVLQNTRQTRAVQQKLTAALLDYYRTK